MISEALKESVKRKDLIAIRAALQSKILLDHDMETGDFSENLNFCLQNGISEKELFVKLDDVNPVSNEISADNFKKMYSFLGVNFAKERVECLKNITKALWPKEQKSEAPQNTDDSSNINAKSFDGEERVLSVSEKEIIPTKQKNKPQPSPRFHQSDSVPLSEGETLVSSTEREIPVVKKEIHGARRYTTNNNGKEPGFGVRNEKRPEMTNEMKALIAVGAVILVAATVIVVVK